MPPTSVLRSRQPFALFLQPVVALPAPTLIARPRTRVGSAQRGGSATGRLRDRSTTGPVDYRTGLLLLLLLPEHLPRTRSAHARPTGRHRSGHAACARH